MKEVILPGQDIFIVTCEGVTVEWTGIRSKAQERFDKADGNTTFVVMNGDVRKLLDQKGPKKFRGSVRVKQPQK